MPRTPRADDYDSWHHCVNRGIAKRTLFESPKDCRVFLALIAKEVRRGRIELHAYSLMATHFHLLVRSVNGQLSQAMRAIQLGYSRWFNRTRRRDGPLYRGRFSSDPIYGLESRRRVVRYIHDNPVQAKIVAHPHDFLWSSAIHLAADRRPKWLCTDWVDGELQRRGGGGTREEQLESAFPSKLDPEFRAQVAQRLRHRIPQSMIDEDNSGHHVVGAHTMHWMIRKTKLADGTRPWQHVVRREDVEESIRRARESMRADATRFVPPPAVKAIPKAGGVATRQGAPLSHVGTHPTCRRVPAWLSRVDRVARLSRSSLRASRRRNLRRSSRARARHCVRLVTLRNRRVDADLPLRSRAAATPLPGSRSEHRGRGTKIGSPWNVPNARDKPSHRIESRPEQSRVLELRIMQAD